MRSFRLWIISGLVLTTLVLATVAGRALAQDRQAESQKTGGGDGHIRVTGKIAIDLNRIKQDPIDDGSGGIGVWIGEDELHERRKIVGNAGLFDESNQKENQIGPNWDP